MKTVRPFSNGTEFMEWQENNCSECIISTTVRNSSVFLCHIDKELIRSYFEDGLIDKKIADKIGFENGFLRNCPFKNAYSMKPVKVNTIVMKHNQLKLF